MVVVLNTGSPSNAREGSGACGASSEKKNMEGPGSELAHCHRLSTTRNVGRGVSPTTEGRRERLSQDTVTRRVRQARRQPIVGSIGTCQCVARSLRSGGNLFPVDSINHSPTTTGTRSASVWSRVGSSTGLWDWLQPKTAGSCAAHNVCVQMNARRVRVRNLQLCNNLLRVSVSQLEGCNQIRWR